jgi:hypothetical protein
MRLRENKINSALTVFSQPGRGTAITAILVLDGESAGTGASEKERP